MQATIRIYTLLIILISNQLHAMRREEQVPKTNQIETLAQLKDYIKQTPEEEIQHLPDYLTAYLSPRAVTEYFYTPANQLKGAQSEAEDLKLVQEMIWKWTQNNSYPLWKNAINQITCEMRSEKGVKCQTVSSYEMLDATSSIILIITDELVKLREENTKLKLAQTASKEKNSKLRSEIDQQVFDGVAKNLALFHENTKKKSIFRNFRKKKTKEKEQCEI